MSDDLYDRDFYLWTKGQSAALRARRFGDNVLEIDRLAEEIEDLGSAQRNKCESHAQRIVEHFYKLSGSVNAEPRRHWLVEIVNFREALTRWLTPSIRREIEAEFGQLHHRAFRAAAKELRLYEPDVQLDPEQCWTFEEVVGEAAEDPFDRFAETLAKEDRPREPRPH